MKSQSFTIKDAGTQLYKRKDAPIRLTIEQADEVIDALRWVDDDWENMDEAERITHKGMRDAFYAILDQYPIHTDARSQAEIDAAIALEDHLNRKAGIYPEPEGDPSY